MNVMSLSEITHDSHQIRLRHRPIHITNDNLIIQIILINLGLQRNTFCLKYYLIFAM